MFKKTLILLFLFCSFLTVFSSIEHYKINHYTTDEGLSQNNVECIFRDSHGFIWFGTQYGLNRFDGYSFTTYNKNNSSISDGYISDIVEAPNGNLWIGTRNGINLFDYNTETFTQFRANINNPQQSISNNFINVLLFDEDNKLWVGSEEGGLECITLNDSLNRFLEVKKYPIDFTNPKGISGNNVFSLLKSSHGFLYIGSIYGLDKLNLKTGEISKFQDPLNEYFFPTSVVHALFEDSEKNIWIGTENGLLTIDYRKQKLIRYQVNSDFTEPESKSIHSGLVNSIQEDKNGNILIGTLGSLELFDKSANVFTIFPVNTERSQSLNSSFINDLLCDESGNVWIATDNGGVNHYNVNQKPFNYISGVQEYSEDDLQNAIVNSIYKDDKYLWIGTAGRGINYIEHGKTKVNQFMYSESSNSISGDFITSIKPGKLENEMWFGTWGQGICKGIIQKNGSINFKTYLYQPITVSGEPFIYVSCLKYDQKGTLWAGTAQGLFFFDQKKDRFIKIESPSKYGTEVKNIGTLEVDQKNNLWIGTTIGLYRIPLKYKQQSNEVILPDSIYSYKANTNKPFSLTGNYITDIHKDSEGNLWFAVYGEGINKLDRLTNKGKEATFSHINIYDGLSSPAIYCIEQDEHKNLWISSDNGLTKYNLNTNSSTIYQESDGLRSNQFYWSASFKDKKGNIYLGTTKGLLHFNPDSIISNQAPPKVVITKFKLFNKDVPVSDDGILQKSISETEEITLKHKQNIITFEFTSLSYSAPKNNKFQYKLDGFEEEWVDRSFDRRFVTYTNLDPGFYTFMVKGSNNDGLWSNEPTKISLTIKPPWWRTTIFYIITGAFLIACFFLISLIHNKNLRRSKLKLEKLVHKRTNDLKEKTKALDYSNKELMKINETKNKLFTVIAHDLKSPFNVILGMTDILQTSYDEFDNEEIKDMLDSINLSSNNLYNLLENLLQWVRSQRVDLSANKEYIEIKEIVDKTIKLYDKQTKDKSIQLIQEVNSTGKAYGDKNMIDVVIRNLVSNAIKFTSNGSITIKTEDFNNHMITVKVIDSGVGMNQDQVNSLFNVKESRSTVGTGGERGTGLGLLVCKEFVEKNNGQIEVHSVIGKGTTFSFTVPKTES